MDGICYAGSAAGFTLSLSLVGVLRVPPSCELPLFGAVPLLFPIAATVTARVELPTEKKRAVFRVP